MLGCLLAFAFAQPGPVTADQQSIPVARFWTPPEGLETCGPEVRSSSAPFELTEVLHSRRQPYDNGVNFGRWFGGNLGRSLAGDGTEEFKFEIVEIARQRPFIVLDFEGTANSPIYPQSNILRLIAMAITHFESEGILSASERADLVAWGEPMVEPQTRRKKNGSADSRAASGVALMAWGSIKGDDATMLRGYQQWREGLDWVLSAAKRPLRRQSKLQDYDLGSLSLYDEYNLTLAHVIEGAAILQNLAVDSYEIRHSGVNLHEAVEWWTDVVAERPEGFQGFSRARDNFHMGWIPIYLSQHPNEEWSAQLAQMAEDVSGGLTPMFMGISLGGPSDCLWGYDRASLAEAPVRVSDVPERKSDLVLELQSLLSDLGFDAGAADGLIGPRTRRAIGDFQRSQGLMPTGEPGGQLLLRLREQAT